MQFGVLFCQFITAGNHLRVARSKVKILCATSVRVYHKTKTEVDPSQCRESGIRCTRPKYFIDRHQKGRSIDSIEFGLCGSSSHCEVCSSDKIRGDDRNVEQNQGLYMSENNTDFVKL